MTANSDRSRRIDEMIRQVLRESDSDVEGRPLHDPIVRLVLARLRARRLRVSRREVEERLAVVLRGEA